jgi:hypothetical protein
LDRKLPRTAYLPLIQKEMNRLPGWRAELLLMGGRLTLLNAVLTTQPVFYMFVFLLPKWVTRRLKQIRRSFLWHGHKQQQGSKKGISLASRALVTITKELGGLRVQDLEQMNKSLLIKWMWQWVSTEQVWWKEATVTSGPHIRPWEMAQMSTFWMTIAKLAPIFNTSVTFVVRQGNTTQFWHAQRSIYTIVQSIKICGCLNKSMHATGRMDFVHATESNTTSTAATTAIDGEPATGTVSDWL